MTTTDTLTDKPATDKPATDKPATDKPATDKPAWAGDDVLSRFVNLLIGTKPIYAVMKSQARRVLIKTAEKNGVQWRDNYKVLEASGVKETFGDYVNPAVGFPDYYQVPFHAYDEGNLCWAAAFEAESATYAMALRVWPDEALTWQAAQDRLRSSFHAVLAEQGPAVVKDVLDMGCSVGISTRSLKAFYERTQNHSVRTVGLDLSPYMLSVAAARSAGHDAVETGGDDIEWIHAKAEQTGLPDASFDVVTLQFVIHELPRHITQAIFKEAHRLLRPGGSLALVDNDPGSPVIQSLPPVLFTLMKSTEPWSDDYYTFNVEAALGESGFEAVVTAASDPRHRTMIGRKPR